MPWRGRVAVAGGHRRRSGRRGGTRMFCPQRTVGRPLPVEVRPSVRRRLAEEQVAGVLPAAAHQI